MSISWGNSKSNGKSESTTAPVTADSETTLSKGVTLNPPLNSSEDSYFITETRSQPTLPSTISESSLFEGKITGEADLMILGRYNGTIDLPKSMVTAAASSKVSANIVADKVQIEGELTGDICAREVKVLKTGVVVSNIISPRVSIEDGAKIKGSIDMDERLIQEKFEKLNNKPGISPKLMPFKDKNIHKEEGDTLKQ